MTNEEALKWLDKHIIDNLDVKLIASKAIKKQIPKKPTADYHCSTCEADIIESVNYCWNCGQAIDRDGK
ncbi:MAG: hypothetical protein KBS62_03405 [Oscillospiraceae bacterium]|nr:hypothetical protein [Candidatus Ruminococcus equi]